MAEIRPSQRMPRLFFTDTNGTIKEFQVRHIKIENDMSGFGNWRTPTLFNNISVDAVSSGVEFETHLELRIPSDVLHINYPTVGGIEDLHIEATQCFDCNIYHTRNNRSGSIRTTETRERVYEDYGTRQISSPLPPLRPLHFETESVQGTVPFASQNGNVYASGTFTVGVGASPQQLYEWIDSSEWFLGTEESTAQEVDTVTVKLDALPTPPIKAGQSLTQPAKRRSLNATNKH